MNKEELKALVAQALREEAGAPISAGEALEDLAAADIRRQYLVDNPANEQAFLDLKAKTPARVGIGRAGARYKTATMLRFRADHAAAQDSVFSHVPDDFAEKNGLVQVQTKCRDKDEYLTRPDLGRRFDEENQKIIREALGQSPQVVLAIGDGLSAAAVEANAAPCAAAIRQGLSAQGIQVGKGLSIRYCRVGASDHIGQLTGAALVCLLVGERPGLVTAESLSAYITYRPHIGTAESERTVVSNIHRQGTPAEAAGAQIAAMIPKMLSRQCSGVAFRREEA